jgi:2-C-methyl-D-erythritol 4-phosphate cytidylyltransferase
MSSNYVIIVAGGLGNRMNNDVPKQFIKLNGKEIILYSIEKFLLFDPSIKIIAAAHKKYISFLKEILRQNNLTNIEIVEGGRTRFESVKNGLSLIDEPDSITGIHDAARPLVSLQTIKDCFETAFQKGNAVPAVPVSESIREISNGNNSYANRNNYAVIQTPQCFLSSKIKAAYELSYSDNFTDDASVLEAKGEKINLVEGNIENIKITHQKDLIIAKALLENEQR